MLALHGFDTYGLDVSPTAVSAANSYAKAELANPSAQNFSDPEKRPSVDAGTVKFIVGDFFKSGWEKESQDGDTSPFKGFDLIYDYTVSFPCLPFLRPSTQIRYRDVGGRH
jgi:methyl halide transferase